MTRTELLRHKTHQKPNQKWTSVKLHNTENRNKKITTENYIIGPSPGTIDSVDI